MAGTENMEAIVGSIESVEGYQRPIAFGVGLCLTSAKGRVLEVFYPILAYRGAYETAAVLAHLTGYRNGTKVLKLSAAQCQEASRLFAGSPQRDHSRMAQVFDQLSLATVPIVATLLAEDQPPATTEEAYLKLSLLSHRLVKPRELNLDTVFKVLPNVAHTSEGPIDIEDLPERQFAARLKGKVLDVFSVDKFPKMLNHVAPPQVRIADGARVRLGAYLGPGTTVMPEGLINFNAGAAGPNMIDGRIQPGAFVDSGTDLGGSSSIMGTIYRNEKVAITIGKDCVLGANAGTGICLGNECTVESGLYVTAGTKVTLLDRTGKKIGVVKARDLSGKSNLLFRRNSTTGEVEALESKATVMLNEALHINK